MFPLNLIWVGSKKTLRNGFGHARAKALWCCFTPLIVKFPLAGDGERDKRKRGALIGWFGFGLLASTAPDHDMEVLVGIIYWVVF